VRSSFWRDREPPWPWLGPFPVIAVEMDDRRLPLTGGPRQPGDDQVDVRPDKCNLELVVPAAVAGVRHFWRDGREITGVAGVPSSKAGRGTKKRNFELIAPLAGGGLAAYWRRRDVRLERTGAVSPSVTSSSSGHRTQSIA